MNKKPLVTVICICYNHESYVTQALNSIIEQTFKPIEIIIVDDCSGDNSALVIKNWLKQFPQVKFLLNTINLGVTKSFNKAKALSKGDYIIDLAADDILMENAVETLISVFNQHENIAIAYGNAALIDGHNNFIENYYTSDHEGKSGDLYKSIISQTLKINSVASMIKTKVIDSLGGYDESLLYEDLDIWIRASRNYPFNYVDEIIVKKRIIASSLSNQFNKPLNKFSKRLNRSVYIILRKAYHLNRDKSENKALIKRVRNEMKKSLKNYNLLLALKYLLLEISLKLNLNLK
ncbi:glycosyltransferase family 2 protein [Paucihalobacter sp.]|uniref:glycosyltransferase family 2 protein n=1 Tax=Paucihalobacter sp. TaxID=2850405 RepID=UPI002FE1526C